VCICGGLGLVSVLVLAFFYCGGRREILPVAAAVAMMLQKAGRQVEA